MKAYHERTDAAVEAAVKAICNAETTEDAVKQRIKNEIGYTGPILIASTSISSGLMTMTMFMVMIFGPSGEIINV
ncbi:MAG: hypothetical protein AAB568_01525 [Patescibacteria group bacterium]